MGKDVNKRKSMRRAKVITELCISAVILAGGAYLIKNAMDNAETLGTSPYMESSDSAEPTTELPTEPIDPNKVIFTSNSVATKDKFRGNLILVNSEYEYFSGDEELIVINEQLSTDGRTSYVGEDNNTQTLKSVYTPLSEMLDTFWATTGLDDIVITAGFRTAERQQELYDEDLEANDSESSTKVALPGHSEHESGYAIDFSTSTTWTYDGTGDYSWINDHCWEYGFILRYPEDKTDITQIQYESWHYRYVGVPHAFYIKENNLCLEEYIDVLRDYTYEGEHLEFADGNGAEYEIYFVPSDDGAETTNVPVPNTLKYEISGNNVDGFIVTVYKDENQEITEESSEDSSTDDSSEETSEESSEETSEESSEESTAE